MARISDDDIKQLYDVVFSNIQQDRKSIKGIYDEVRALLSGNLNAYATTGDTLAKYAELLVKQNSQVVELLKVAQKDKPSEEGLTAADYDKINEEIEGKKER